MFDYLAWQHTIGSIAGVALAQTFSFLPNLIGAILVLWLGIVFGNWSRAAIVKAFQLLKFESMFQDTAIKKILKKADITHKLEDVFGVIIKWVIMLIFFIASVNILGLTTVSDLLVGILGYIPSILSAVIVLAIGILLAGIVERVVKAGLATVDLKTSRLMGKIASYAVVTIASLAAMSELNIAENFVNILFVGFVAMLTLGFGLAIGLGGKDLVSKFLTDWYADLIKELKKKK